MKRPVVLLTTEELESRAWDHGFPVHATADYAYAVRDGIEFRAYFVSEVTC